MLQKQKQKANFKDLVRHKSMCEMIVSLVLDGLAN